MNFLRSVIADARPRRSTIDPVERLREATGELSHRFDGDAFGGPQGFSNRRVPTDPTVPPSLVRQAADPLATGEAEPLAADRAVDPDAPAPADRAAPQYPHRQPSDRAQIPFTQDLHAPQETDILIAPQDPRAGGEASQPPSAGPPLSSAPIESAAGATPPDGRMHAASVAVSQAPGESLSAVASVVAEPVRTPDNFAVQPDQPSTDDLDPSEQARAGKPVRSHDGPEWPAPMGRKTPAQGEAAVAASSEAHDLPDGVSTNWQPPDDGDQYAVNTASVQIKSHPPDALEEGRTTRTAPVGSGGKIGIIQAGPGRPATDIPRKTSSPISSAADRASPRLPEGPFETVSLLADGTAAPAGGISGSPSAESGRIGNPDPGAAGPADRREVLPTVPARPFRADLTPRGSSPPPWRPAAGPSAGQDAAPKVQIGQIDVIIDAGARPATKPAQTPSPNDLASRHYLRRL
ncbi:MAG: hypothetical protein QNJ01_17865 [Desulfobacterales bacterium]|nr:hypothetical protein [Desulfobacterales bacterium]